MEQQAYYRQMQMLGYSDYARESSGADESEMVGPLNGQISVRAYVRATYELK
jgi:hypothetical protein